MEKKLVQLVEQYLSVHLVDNAIFMAERLLGASASEANKHLLATCHVHAGQPKQAVSCLQGCRDPANRYLLARCLTLVREFAEAEDVLVNPAGLRGKNAEEIARAMHNDSSIIPHGAAGVQLLAQAALATERVERAVALYQLSLQLDPFLWTSFEALVSLGAAPEPATCFHANTLPLPQLQSVSADQSSAQATGMKQRAHSQGEAEGMRQHSGVKRGFAEVSSAAELSAESKFIPRIAVPVALSPPLTPAMKLQLGSPEGMSLAPVGPKLLSCATEQLASNPDGVERRLAGHVPDLQKRRGRVAGSGGTPAVNDSRNVYSSSAERKHNAVQALTFSASSSVSRAHPAFASIPGRQLASAFQSLPRASETPSGIHDISSIAGTPAAGSLFPESGIHSALETSNRIIGMSYTPLVQKMKSFSLESQPQRPAALSSENPARSLWFSEVEDSLGPASIIMSKKLNRSKSAEEAAASQDHKLGRSAHVARITKPTKPRADEEDINENLESFVTQIYRGGLQVLALLKSLGGVLVHVDGHCSELVVTAASRLPACHTQTAYVLYLLARSFAEAGKYAKAKETFSELLKRWPTRLQGIDLFSTVLWHLRDRDALQALAHSSVRLHGHIPITLCVVANSCSLRNDHENALKYLAAATAKDPSYVYAHTLAGHESLAIGDFDQAIQHFRQALKIDSRHYNALYGLGTVFLKQECLDIAESHFMKALELNRYSAVLFCYLGMVQHGLKRFEAAIDTLNKASELDPANPQAMYQRALVYISVGKLEAARKELALVLEFAPSEMGILVQLGKINKKLGRTQEATDNFNQALKCCNSDKEANTIKNLLNALQSGAEDDEGIY